MPKLKTRKSVAKRFKITATGKVLMSKPGRRHLLTGKSSKRKRKMRKKALASRAFALKIKRQLPYG